MAQQMWEVERQDRGMKIEDDHDPTPTMRLASDPYYWWGPPLNETVKP